MRKETLVFLPGTMCDARLFGPQIFELSAEHPAMVIPLTQGERIEEMASNIVPVLAGRVALAGAGLGGAVALEILRRAPERVSRLALISTNPLADTPQEAAAREEQIVAARTGQLTQAMQGLVPSNALAEGPQRSDVRFLINDMADFLGADVFVRQIRALQRMRDHQSTLRKCKVPVSVIGGDEDRMLPVRRHEFTAGLLPYGSLRVISKAGHLPSLENPFETTRALREWLAQPLVLQ